MRSVTTVFVGAVLAVSSTSTGAVAQSYYDDQACRQYADAQIAPLRNQAGAQAGAETFGSALLGAGVGAAIGGAVGGGRGAGIGAASGAIVGGSAGAANAQNTAAYVQPQYNAYYAQCMASRRPPPPPYVWRAAGGLWARPGLRLPALVL
jgi:outer membrane lipoprotein SlyB